MASDYPVLWLCFSMTVVQVSILVWGAWRFRELIALCQAADSSGRYPKIKTALLLLMYVYAPLVVVSVTFMWVANAQQWTIGFFFLGLPFLSVIVFLLLILVSRNDISNYVDITRYARSKLPAQPLPPPLTLGVGSVPTPRRPPAPPPVLRVDIAPPIPMQDGAVDEDAF